MRRTSPPPSLSCGVPGSPVAAAGYSHSRTAAPAASAAPSIRLASRAATPAWAACPTSSQLSQLTDSTRVPPRVALWWA